jgi:photosystem II stability/assembly factor-like uncharacterized protein
MRPFLRVRTFAMLAIALAVAAAAGLVAQGPPFGQPQPPAPPVNPSDDPILKTFVWRSIGPASMGGRIDDIEGVESNPSVFYVGFATGGLWKTVNNGTTFTPIFDTYPVASIGDIALSPSNPDIVWVGTGEPNNRQSSSFGNGVYKSTDGGKTFTHMGLTDTQSIGRIVIDPKDPNIVYVAAVGHLFGPNEERGVFKTTDGGKTWQKVKYIDADTGFIDLAMDPSDPKTLYAASYQRRRVPWGFNGGGPGSGIWKTTDAGKTWTRLSGNGLPDSPIIGRIGLSVCRSKPSVVYAQIEVGPSGGTGAGVSDEGLPIEPGQGGRGGGAGFGQQEPQNQPPDPKRSGVWRSDDRGKTWRIVSNNNNRPMYYSQIRCDPTNPDIVYTMGAPFFKSVDGGKTFRQVSGIAHSDHHALWIDPKNPNHLILGNDGGLDVSYDQGETWEFINTMAVGQFYAISADMRKPYYVCGGLQDNGSWCGPSAVRSPNGILNADWYRVGGGDGFYTQNDPTDHMVLYAESQDGNTTRVELRAGRSMSIRPRAAAAGRGGRGGGGGAAGGQAPAGAAAGDPEAFAQLAQQFGFGVPTAANVVPPPPPGTTFRFYWNTPFILSPHNPRVIYLGGERLFKSVDRGQTWTMSPDLTRNISRFSRPIMGVPGDKPMASKHDGAASYSNITTIAESPVQPGVIWVGTNDGNVQVSRDGGVTWKNVIANVKGVPDETHVSRVEASHFDAGTCYVTFDGHRTDDHRPYVYVTRDFGETWTSIAGNLPMGNVNVIREDPKNPSLLYLGTEYAFYVSLDGGREWKRFMTGLPTVRIDDILVHPRDNDLIVGTHGRSIYIIDDITPLQALTAEVAAKNVHLFDPRPATLWRTDMTLARQVGGAKHFRGENPRPGTAVSYYLKTAPDGDVTITILDVTGRVVRTLTGTKHAGLNRVQWDLRANPPQVPGGPAAGRGAGGRGRFGGAAIQGPLVEPGVYLVRLSVGGQELTTKVVVEADPGP